MKSKKMVNGIMIVLLVAVFFAIQPVFASATTGMTPGMPPVNQAKVVSPRLTAVAQHSLEAVVTEVGKINVSINAIGENTGSGVLTIVKPEGATVRKAYMAAATTGFSGYKLAPGDIAVDGAPVTWDTADLSNDIGSYNYFTDVTTMVKSKIDSAPAGDVSFTVSEANTYDIEGEILVVIFDDPLHQTTDNTVVLLFGAQKTTGDDFNIGLAKPIDKTDPNLLMDFSLGISYGYQTTAVQNQFSTVDVDGKRMSSSAGGQDDGQGANGALITVGGVGDSDANPPDPYSGPVTGCRYDDELYSLLPFVANGDTAITVHTVNPSNDDNIFFGALYLRSATAVVGQGVILSPVSATNNLGKVHTLTAKVQDANGNPVVGTTVTFTVTSGPNAGVTGTGITDATGQTTFSYTSSTVGVDTITASFVDPTGKTITSNSATKTWVKGTIPVPEFPALAIPVSMLVGIVLIVYGVKRRI
jgi:hypothetical protein